MSPIEPRTRKICYCNIFGLLPYINIGGSGAEGPMFGIGREVRGGSRSRFKTGVVALSFTLEGWDLNVRDT